jgi:hypothetical protein
VKEKSVGAFFHTHIQPNPCRLWLKNTLATPLQIKKNKPNPKQNAKRKQVCGNSKAATPTQREEPRKSKIARFLWWRKPKKQQKTAEKT